MASPLPPPPPPTLPLPFAVGEEEPFFCPDTEEEEEERYENFPALPPPTPFPPSSSLSNEEYDTFRTRDDALLPNNVVDEEPEVDKPLQREGDEGGSLTSRELGR